MFLFFLNTDTETKMLSAYITKSFPLNVIIHIICIAKKDEMKSI